MALVKMQSIIGKMSAKLRDTVRDNEKSILCLHIHTQGNTVEARFSGHQFSGKPRFKGHSSENMGNRFLFLVHKSAQNSGKSRFSGQTLGERFSAKSSFHCISCFNDPRDLLFWNEVWTLTSFDLQTSANLPVASSSAMSTTLLISVKFIILMCFIGLYPVTSIQVCSPRCNFWFWKSPFVKCEVIYKPKTSSSILRAYLSLGEHRRSALPCCWYPRGEECQHHQGLDRHPLHQHPVEIRRTYQNLYPYLLKIPLSRRFDSFFTSNRFSLMKRYYTYT